jgi:hypothetical protein
MIELLALPSHGQNVSDVMAEQKVESLNRNQTLPK